MSDNCTVKDNTPDELEDKLRNDSSFQHILKFAPQSQRELMTFELAQYFRDYIAREINVSIGEYSQYPSHFSISDVLNEQRQRAADRGWRIGR